MFHHVGVNVYPVNTTKARIVIQEDKNPGAVSNVSNMESEDCVGSMKAVVSILGLLIISNLQI